MSRNVSAALAAVALTFSQILFLPQTKAGAVGINGVTVTFTSGSLIGNETSAPNSVCHRVFNADIYFYWGEGGPGGSCPSDYFAAYAEGSIVGPTTGTVSFCSENDDAFRLQIGPSLVIDSWRAQANGDCGVDEGANGYGSMSMSSGQTYPLRAIFNEYEGGAVMRLYWRYGEMTDYQAVPLTSFTSCANSFTTLSQGGWSNSATSSPLTESWFTSNFPSGVKIGDLTGSGGAILITSASNLKQFLPQSGTPASLTGTLRTNPNRNNLRNSLAGQVTALTLNMALNPNLGSRYLAFGYSDTVSNLLAEANLALKGPASKSTLSNLTNLAEYVNLSFPMGVDQGRISCTAPPS